ncbi:MULTISPECIES: hypothetical protein [Streptomyces]|uniref:ABC transporter substrate-binding protein n=2 Tax=Streptomyces TaxID=1883 RepID=A0AA89Q507_STRCU|nr:MULTISPECIES: hypothetical protein [Streptomyces]MBB5814382.1 hypothetical protein [Streptomyces collinus]MEC7057254.1 hypothetical protein [Streptomyces violaceochromogenes]WMX67403.1 hypothetical protein RFN52_30225 [Streptomyces collinus]
MKPRTALGALALATMPLFLATPAQVAEDPVGPGLSELVAIAEGILRKYGIPKSFADVQDLDAGILAIASGILNINEK